MKKLFLYLLISNIILLNTTFSLHAMEVVDNKEKGGIELDWDYGIRKSEHCCCWVKKDGHRYPYFLEQRRNDRKIIHDQQMKQVCGALLGDQYDISSLTNEDKQA